MMQVAEALSRVLALGRPLETEVVPLAVAGGRAMAVAPRAQRDQPPFPASAMDGYAVCGDPVAGDSLSVIGSAAAGHGWQGSIGPGQALRIFTGAPVPPGATRVVIQEDVEATGDRITLREGADGSDNIRPQGSDFRAGEAMEPRVLRPADLALLAAMNAGHVTVTRRPVVALVATGDELVMPGEVPRDDQIVASNIFALKAMVEAAGGIARLLPIARDSESHLATVLDLALEADLLVTIGGASVGDHDIVGKVATGMGLERDFYRIAMRPGKPLMAGRLRGVPMLGLPGNPVAAIVCGHLFLLPLLRVMLGLGTAAPAPMQARLAAPLGRNGARTHYMRATLGPAVGLPLITAFDRQDSAMLSDLVRSDALLVRPVADGPRAAGEMVDYLPI